ncbi:nucleotide sugar dehydrogenase [Xanthobacter sp. DSM 24535]|uniref:nucleotide sugar dehydrogenase n=1 Tax=Roseixanthobacter psychrophilus TaxID=3119917 RepID=UPI00372737AC
MKVPHDFKDRRVCIIGLGYVGLTLAVAMAEVGFEVYGVEHNPSVVSAIMGGSAHFSEFGLDVRLRAQVATGRLKASQEWPDALSHSVYIITVGTPLSEGKVTNLTSIVAVSQRLREILSDNDLVILRSTVRIGVTRDFVKPVLDKANVKFGLAFCPERTLEGRALLELRSLPQIVGGIDESSVLRASQLFNFLTPTTIRVRDVETAEMIKLINNTQRDLMFAFANEVASMCDATGISALEVIRAGNMGYARASMPVPGPVGGPCLEKDAYILAESVRLRGGEVQLTLMGRSINEALPAQTVKHVAEFLDGVLVKKIAIGGLAFKGRPETSDLRGTLAIPLIARLREKYPSAEIFGFDPAITEGDIAALGVSYAGSPEDAFRDANCVIFQNNNANFEHLDLNALSQSMAPGAVIYDLWNQFDPETLKLAHKGRYFGLGTRMLTEHPEQEYAGKTGSGDAPDESPDAGVAGVG